MPEAQSPKQQRTESRSGGPGGILWLLKWLVLLALVVLLILAVIPTDTAFAGTLGNTCDADPRRVFTA